MTENAEEIAAVFGRAAGTYDTVVPFFTLFGQRLVELVDLRPGERVLDLASGRGAALIPAAERVGPTGSVVGVDLATEMVDLLASDLADHNIANASVRRMDVHDLDLPDQSFDVVLCGFVLHLLPDVAAAAAECRRVLRPGGRCAASVPTGTGPNWDFLGPLFRGFIPRATRRPSMPFNPDFDADAILVAAGFDVVHTADEEIEIVFPDEKTWWDWSWSHGLRELFELLPADVLDELREAAFAKLVESQSDEGLTMTQQAHYVIAAKPGDA